MATKKTTFLLAPCLGEVTNTDAIIITEIRNPVKYRLTTIMGSYPVKLSTKLSIQLKISSDTMIVPLDSEPEEKVVDRGVLRPGDDSIVKLHLTNLVPQTSYKIYWHEILTVKSDLDSGQSFEKLDQYEIHNANDREECLTKAEDILATNSFTTMSDQGPQTIAICACDLPVLQAGVNLFGRMATIKPDLVLRTGDNVYLDDAYNRAEKYIKKRQFLLATHTMRQVYRRTWNYSPESREVWAHCSNLTVPDDHELKNKYPQEVPDDEKSVNAMAIDQFNRYQRQLRVDYDCGQVIYSSADRLDRTELQNDDMLFSLQERTPLFDNSNVLDLVESEKGECVNEKDKSAEVILKTSGHDNSILDQIEIIRSESFETGSTWSSNIDDLVLSHARGLTVSDLVNYQEPIELGGYGLVRQWGDLLMIVTEWISTINNKQFFQQRWLEIIGIMKQKAARRVILVFPKALLPRSSGLWGKITGEFSSKQLKRVYNDLFEWIIENNGYIGPDEVKRHLLLVFGDLHIGGTGYITNDFNGDELKIPFLLSTPITNYPFIYETLSRRAMLSSTRQVKGYTIQYDNLVCKRNFGLVKIDQTGFGIDLVEGSSGAPSLSRLVRGLKQLS